MILSALRSALAWSNSRSTARGSPNRFLSCAERAEQHHGHKGTVHASVMAVRLTVCGEKTHFLRRMDCPLSTTLQGNSLGPNLHTADTTTIGKCLTVYNAHTLIHTWMHMCTSSPTHTRTHAHAHTHTHTHTHPTHPHTHTRSQTHRIHLHTP